MLELDELNKSYGALRALRDLTFDVQPGEIFGFVGSNGAGKSTAMRIVLGVLAADSGQVRWAGQPLDSAIRRRIGYMPEERGLYPRMPAGEQLIYLARLHGLSTVHARAAMLEWTEVLGIAHRRDDEVIKLSLGNQQRVQLAAALVHGPDILVLDEPFSGLDPVAVDVMSGVLRARAAAGVPVMFSSHQLDLVERLCDRVGIIRDGQLVAIGDIDQLRQVQHVRWSVIGAPAQRWFAGLNGLRVVQAQGSLTVVEALGDDPGGLDQQVLAAALTAGPVHEFAVVRPSLSDLYRDVVSIDEKSTDAGQQVPA